MSPVVGWSLALAALAAGWFVQGVAGLGLAASAIIFWLLLQFNRAVRVMKKAADAPIGHVPSAVMLNAVLRRGMTLMQILAQSRSLGRQVASTPETWAWSDAGDAVVTVVMVGGQLDRWALTRPSDGDSATEPGAGMERSAE